MSNSNTRRRKQKKQQRGIQAAHAFAGLRVYGGAPIRGGTRAAPGIVRFNNPSVTCNWTKAWFEELGSGPAPMDDPRRGRFNCAGRYVMPEVPEEKKDL